MDHRLLQIVACPVCNNQLHYLADQQELICKADRLAFPIRDGIPILMQDAARPLSEEEQPL